MCGVRLSTRGPVGGESKGQRNPMRRSEDAQLS